MAVTVAETDGSLMAVTVAETDGSLMAVTVAETETDCRPTDNNVH